MRTPEGEPPSTDARAGHAPPGGPETRSPETMVRGLLDGARQRAADKERRLSRPRALFVDQFHGWSATTAIQYLRHVRELLPVDFVPSAAFDFDERLREQYERRTGLASRPEDAHEIFGSSNPLPDGEVIEGVFSGSPCQGLSLAREQAASEHGRTDPDTLDEDPRNELYVKQAVDFIRSKRKWAIFEQVPAVRHRFDGALHRRFLEPLHAEGCLVAE